MVVETEQYIQHKRTQHTTCRNGIIYFCTCKPVQQKAGCDTNALFRNVLCCYIEPTYMHSPPHIYSHTPLSPDQVHY